MGLCCSPLAHRPLGGVGVNAVVRKRDLLHAASSRANASTAKGTATRKTVCREWLKAADQRPLTAGGRWSISAGLTTMLEPLTIERSADVREVRLRHSENSRLLNTAFSTDTPNAPPMVRKNVAVEVAVPSCS